MVVDLVGVNEILPGVKSVDPWLQENKPYIKTLFAPPSKFRKNETAQIW